MRREITKFIIHLAALMLGVVIMDFAVGKTGQWLLKRLPDYGDRLITKPNFALNRVTADILIVGSSRADHHYVPLQLKDSIEKYSHKDFSIYNAGQHNQGFNYFLCVIESALQRHTPKVIILDVENLSLIDSETFQTKALRPYIDINPIVKSELSKVKGKEALFLKSNLYDFNGQLLQIVLNTTDKSTDSNSLYGYAPLLETFDARTYGGEKALSYDFKTNINPMPKEDFERIISLCHNKDIRLIVCISPNYGLQEHNNMSYITIHSLCQKNNVPFIDMENDKFFDTKPYLFYDPNHLNSRGAVIFTSQFFAKAKPFLTDIK
jgi:hypothetical protein